MHQELKLYIDDSGTRHPNRNPKLPSHGYDWFSLGGVVIDAELEDSARGLHAAFCKTWKISIGGYHRSNRTYVRLIEDRKLIDCHLAEEDIEALGIKYSCWENVAVKP